MNKEQFITLGFSEDQATKAAEASAEELKTYIPKHRFDEVNEENKTLKVTVKENAAQLESLKVAAGSNEELKKQIETLQSDNKQKDEQYQAQLKDLTLTNAIKMALADKAQDTDLVAGLVDKAKLILAEDGKVTGLDEQVKSLKESKAFLFKEEKQQTPPAGFKIGADGKQVPIDPGKPANLFDAVAGALKQN